MLTTVTFNNNDYNENILHLIFGFITLNFEIKRKKKFKLFHFYEFLSSNI